jgi:hypothetical protein
MGWLTRLRGTGTAEEQRRSFARVVAVLLWLFAAAFALGAVQVWRALHSGKTWANYRGQLIGHQDMLHTFIFMVVATALCILLALRWQRFLRRGR